MKAGHDLIIMDYVGHINVAGIICMNYVRVITIAYKKCINTMGVCEGWP